jgi:hypothetical protein
MVVDATMPPQPSSEASLRAAAGARADATRSRPRFRKKNEVFRDPRRRD